MAITREILLEAHSKMRPKKSCGTDGIPMMVVRDSLLEYIDAYLLLFNRILDEGNLPVKWKSAIITPVHKKGPRCQITNYCPVSGLCSVSKLFERCVMELMHAPILEGDHQHGFRKNHSTVTAMFEAQSIIADALDSNQKVLMYSTDLSAAFDLLRPGILVNRIKKHLPFKITRIIADFLHHRNYRVKLGNSLSSSYDLKMGCAQGSTLGPKLFSMYCGGLSEVVDANLVVYADDAYVLVKGDDIIELQERMSKILKAHVDWLGSIGMVVNVDKTEAVLFSREKLDPLILTVNGTSFSTKSSMKVLGVTFDSRLRWDVQVQNV